jgi:hypothetical protein
LQLSIFVFSSFCIPLFLINKICLSFALDSKERTFCCELTDPVLDLRCLLVISSIFLRLEIGEELDSFLLFSKAFFNRDFRGVEGLLEPLLFDGEFCISSGLFSEGSCGINLLS